MTVYQSFNVNGKAVPLCRMLDSYGLLRFIFPYVVLLKCLEVHVN